MIFQQRLAKRMRSCMSSENLNINELADRLGVSKSSISDYLQEKGNPRANTIELIYEKLGCSLEKFVEGKSEAGDDMEWPDFASLLGRMETMHPLLKPLTVRSYEMAEEILQISDALNEYERARKEQDPVCE